MTQVQALELTRVLTCSIVLWPTGMCPSLFLQNKSTKRKKNWVGREGEDLGKAGEGREYEDIVQNSQRTDKKINIKF